MCRCWGRGCTGFWGRSCTRCWGWRCTGEEEMLPGTGSNCLSIHPPSYLAFANIWKESNKNHLTNLILDINAQDPQRSEGHKEGQANPTKLSWTGGSIYWVILCWRRIYSLNCPHVVIPSWGKFPTTRNSSQTPDETLLWAFSHLDPTVRTHIDPATTLLLKGQQTPVWDPGDSRSNINFLHFLLFFSLAFFWKHVF